ncbi:DnaJ-class molecular chaperone [Oleiphilus messinensis]|uniref:DnaJ-class molecular chaperone n=1 Tax=Oleiphilus messinensis TaxID=141451 RepID=A0A1Y0IDA1_9GAMM|nr:DnaJ domain-containing protein [Oleiphilus messinensis]ARU58507.1 DnaJ-class molecular chaperone [Oleiphilus messinensis]
MFKLIVVTAVLLAVFMMRHAWRSASPEERKQLMFKWGVGALISLLVLLTVTGRLHILAAIFTGLLPFARRILPFVSLAFRHIPGLRNWANGLPGKFGSAPQQHQLVTPLLCMNRDVLTQKLSGVVVAGLFKGKDIDTLSVTELLELLDQAHASDEDSVTCVESFLDQKVGGIWRQHYQRGNYSGASNNQSQSPSQDGMSVREAYDILGLRPGATDKEITTAHRRLMQKCHPDRGGTDYLAARLNLARKILMELSR